MKLTTHLQLVPGKESMDLYIHSPLRLLDVLLNYLSSGAIIHQLQWKLIQLRSDKATYLGLSLIQITKKKNIASECDVCVRHFVHKIYLLTYHLPPPFS
jgi:hypothetical protein